MIMYTSAVEPTPVPNMPLMNVLNPWNFDSKELKTETRTW